MADSNAPRKRRSTWNAERPRKSGPPGKSGSLQTRRTIWTLLTLVLVALIGWGGWLMFQDPSKTELAAVIAEVTDQWTVPPLPFPDETIAEWQKHLGKRETGRSVAQAALPATNSQDVLIVFVNAHGFAHDGKAYLAESDFENVAKDSGRTAVKDFLAKVSSEPAGVKLVIFDSGRFATAPAQGMLVNEFPRLLEQETKATGDSGLWVLNATDLHEVSQVDYLKSGSVFGLAVREVLFKEPAADEPLTVSLFALFDQVWKSCDGIQSPILVNGGRKERFTAKDERQLRQITLLTRTPPKAQAADPKAPEKPPAKEAKEGESKPASQTSRSTPRRALLAAALLAAPGDEPAGAETKSKSPPPANAGGKPDQAPPAETKPATEAKEPAATAAPEGAAGEKPATSAKPTPPPDAAGKPPAEAAKRDDEFVQAWKLRDNLLRRAGPLSPGYFAPDLWRRWNGILLHAEQGARLGRRDKALERLPGETRSLEEFWRQIESQQPIAAAREQTTTGGKIVGVYALFQASPLATESAEAGGAQAAELSRRFADQLAVAADFVTWHDHACLLHPDNVVPPTVLVDKFLDKLATFQETLRRQVPATGITAAGLSELERLFKDVVDARENVTDALAAQVQATILADVANRRQIEALLSTPLLDAGDRKQLLDKLQTGGPKASTLRFDASKHWDLVRKRASLHWKLAQLADDGQTPQNLNPEESLTFKGNEDEKWLTACGEWGQELAGFHDRLRSARSGPATSELSALIAAQLVDPRDADTFSDDRRFIAYRIPIQESPPGLEFVGLPEETLRLAEGGTAELAFRIRLRRGGNARPAPVQIVVRAPAALTVDPHPPIFEFKPEGGTSAWMAPATIKVRRASTTKMQGVETLTITAVGEVPDHPPLRAERTVEFRSRAPNRVELVMTEGPRPGGIPQGAPRSAVDGSLLLQPLPNRKTTFSLGLRNDYDEPKDVAVKLFAGLPRASDALPPNQLWVDETRVLLAGRLSQLRQALVSKPQSAEKSWNLKLVAESTTHLDIGAEVVALKLKPPAAPAPKAEGAAPPAPPPAAAAPVSITSGLLCLITEQPKLGSNADPTQWFHWIDMQPLRPEAYLEIPRITYYLPSGNEGRIEIELESEFNPAIPLEAGWTGDDRKSTIKENAVKIVCENWKEISDKPNQRTNAALTPTPQGQRGKLQFSGIEPTDQDIVAELSVDDYPWAFRMVVKLRSSAGPLGVGGRRDDRPSFGIRSVTADFLTDPVLAQLPKSTYYWRTADRPELVAGAIKPPIPKFELLSPFSQPAVFRSPCDALRLRVAIDHVSDPAQGGPAPETAIILGNVDDPILTETLRTERHMEFALAEITDEGKLVVGCVVRDHEVEFKPPVPFENQTVPISIGPALVPMAADRAEMRMGAPSEVQVAMFGTLPSFRLVYEVLINEQKRPGQPIQIGQGIFPRSIFPPDFKMARLRLIRYWIDDSENPESAPEKAPVARAESGFQVELLTKDLKAGTKYYLHAIAMDYAGNTTSEIPSILVPLASVPTPIPAAGAPAKKIPLKVVVLDVRPGGGLFPGVATVTLEPAARGGGPPITGKTDPTTSTANLEVPPGVYRARAEVKLPGLIDPTWSIVEVIDVKADGQILSGGKPLTGPLKIGFGAK